MPDCNLLMMHNDGNLTGTADLWREMTCFGLYVRHVCGRQHLVLPLHFMTFLSTSKVNNPAHCLKVSVSSQLSSGDVTERDWSAEAVYCHVCLHYLWLTGYHPGDYRSILGERR